MSQAPPPLPTCEIATPPAERPLVAWPLQVAHRSVTAGWLIYLVGCWWLAKHVHFPAAQIAFVLGVTAFLCALWAYFAGRRFHGGAGVTAAIVSVSAAVPAWVIGIPHAALGLADGHGMWWLRAGAAMVLVAGISAIVGTVRARRAGESAEGPAVMVVGCVLQLAAWVMYMVTLAPPVR